MINIRDAQSAEEYCKNNLRNFKGFTSLQDSAIHSTEFWDDKKNLFITAPTSSGKTLLAFLPMLHLSENGNYPRILYVVPYRALAYQKEKELKKFLPDDLCDDVVVSTGEVLDNDQDIRSGYARIAVVIYEKVFLFQVMNSNFLDLYDLIILDEFGIVNNEERGIKADFVFYNVVNKKIRCIILTTPFYNWKIYQNCSDFYIIKNENRPVPLVEIIYSKYTQQGKSAPIGYHRIKGENEDIITIQNSAVKRIDLICQICAEHYKLGHTILIFINNREEIRNFIAKIYDYFIEQEIISEVPEKTAEEEFDRLLDELQLERSDLYGIYESSKSEVDEKKNLAQKLRKALISGFCFHSAAIPFILREKIEQDFLNEENKVRIVAATSTLAYGINSNADVVIIADINKPDAGRQVYLTQDEYQNYIGRAGRYGHGHSNIGYVYTIINDNQADLWFNILNQEPPLLESLLFSKSINANKMSLFLLCLFENETSMKEEELLKKITSFPYLKDKQVEFYIKFQSCINDLKSEKLLTEYAPVFLHKKNPQYQLTEYGRSISGYILSMESCRNIKNFLNRCRENKEIKIFDLFYNVFNAPEFYGNHSFRPHKNRDRSISRIYNTLKTEGEKWVNENEMSQSILDRALSIFKGATSGQTRLQIFDEPNIHEFTILREAAIATMSLLGYNNDEIHEAGDTTIGVNTNLMSTAGYYVEVAASMMKADISDESEWELLDRLYYISRSLALGGIPVKIIEIIGPENIYPEKKSLYKWIYQYVTLCKKAESRELVYEEILQRLKLEMFIEELNEEEKEILESVKQYMCA